MGVDCNGSPYKINAEIVESRQRDFTISRSFATVLSTKDLQQFSGRLLEPCPFDLGLRKFALDFIVVFFFKNAKKLQVVV